MAQQERQLILHRSLTTPNLLGGGERELVIVLWTLIAALVFGAGIRPLSLFVGLLVGVGGQFGLIKAAQVDPYWFAIYRRSLTYRAWYPAHSHVKAERRTRPPSVIR
jgi:type IV secretory pathway TrbD component